MKDAIPRPSGASALAAAVEHRVAEMCREGHSAVAYAVEHRAELMDSLDRQGGHEMALIRDLTDAEWALYVTVYANELPKVVARRN